MTPVIEPFHLLVIALTGQLNRRYREGIQRQPDFKVSVIDWQTSCRVTLSSLWIELSAR